MPFEALGMIETKGLIGAVEASRRDGEDCQRRPYGQGIHRRRPTFAAGGRSIVRTIMFLHKSRTRELASSRLTRKIPRSPRSRPSWFGDLSWVELPVRVIHPHVHRSPLNGRQCGLDVIPEVRPAAKPILLPSRTGRCGCAGKDSRVQQRGKDSFPCLGVETEQALG
jgi:hypothetical protein